MPLILRIRSQRREEQVEKRLPIQSSPESQSFFKFTDTEMCVRARPSDHASSLSRRRSIVHIIFSPRLYSRLLRPFVSLSISSFSSTSYVVLVCVFFLSYHPSAVSLCALRKRVAGLARLPLVSYFLSYSRKKKGSSHRAYNIGDAAARHLAAYACLGSERVVIVFDAETATRPRRLCGNSSARSPRSGRVSCDHYLLSTDQRC